MADIFSDAFPRQLHSIFQWLNANGIIAWALFLIVLFFLLAPHFFTGMDLWISRVYTPLAKWIGHRWLVRQATKYDVRGNVNRSVNKLAGQLPDGWVKELDIKWVSKETKEKFFEENKIIVRVRPLADQDTNFVTVLNLFLRQALFGNVAEIIPNLQRTAAILYFGDRISQERGEATCRAFGQRIFEPAIKTNGRILEYFGRYSDLDKKGFFSGPFLREIQHVAAEVRATRFRERMGAEMNDALVHLEQFCADYENSRASGTPMPDETWCRNGIMTKYALILVARPVLAQLDADGGYIARALKNYKSGARRLYIAGSTGQRDFAKRVIRSIREKTPYILEQEFDLFRDYRGEIGGVGAVFVSPDR